MTTEHPQSARAKQLAAALREVEALEQLAWNATLGWANTSVLSQFEQAEFRLRPVVPTGYGRESLAP